MITALAEPSSCYWVLLDIGSCRVEFSGDTKTLSKLAGDSPTRHIAEIFIAKIFRFVSGHDFSRSAQGLTKIGL